MHEILSDLPGGAYVLDLGSSHGSFDPNCTQAIVVRLDREAFTKIGGAHCVQGDAAHLPFRNGQFASVIANHSLEHFDKLNEALQEVGRVLTSSGSLFVSVPDASTFTDKLYRWLARGGGHVNQFTSVTSLLSLIEQVTGLKHVATKSLYSSLSFLNRNNAPKPRPKRLFLLGGGAEWSLFLFAWFSRRLDRLFHSRISIYGWAIYFGRIPSPIHRGASINVCIRCGSGHPSLYLLTHSGVQKRFGLRVYHCPRCAALNPFADDHSLECHPPADNLIPKED